MDTCWICHLPVKTGAYICADCAAAIRRGDQPCPHLRIEHHAEGSYRLTAAGVEDTIHEFAICPDCGRVWDEASETPPDTAARLAVCEYQEIPF